MKNYRIAEHPYYHAIRCMAEAASTLIRSVWREFVQPVSIIACGIAIGFPIAKILGTALGTLWR